jgi:hypothetical protein
MAEQDLANKLICHQCVGDRYLWRQIEEQGEVSECGYCGAAGVRTYRLEQIATEVERVFDHSWALTADQPDGYEYAMSRDPELSYKWERGGMAPVEVVEEVAQVSSEAAEEIVSLLDFRSCCSIAAK